MLRRTQGADVTTAGYSPPVRIHVDADGCPVKDEVYRVAKRCRLEVCVVANKWIDTPNDPLVRMVVVSDGFDAADDWIAEHAEPDDVVVTADIPLAARALNAHLRESGLITGGPAPFRDRDRSQFLQALDAAVQAGKRKRGTA